MIMMPPYVRALSLALGLLLLVAAPARAQSDDTAEHPALTALKKAVSIQDSKERLASYEKILKDYPMLGEEEPRIASTIHLIVAEELIKFAPEKDRDKDKISAHAEESLKYTRPGDKPKRLISLAQSLEEGNILLDKAAGYVSTSIPLIEQELEEDSRQRRAALQTLLGNIYYKMGKPAEASKAFKTALELDPEASEAALMMADIEEKAGNYMAAFNDYLVPVALSGYISRDRRLQLETLYTKAYNKPVSELEKFLDAAYDKKYPGQLKIEPFKPSPAWKNRAVLGELFTSTSCAPCTATDLSFEAAMRRYGRHEFVVLMYHINAPQLDPMTNPSAESRFKYYNAGSTPHFMIDGKLGHSGGSREREDAPAYYGALQKKVEQRLTSPAMAEIKLVATLQGSVVKSNVVVQNVTLEAPKLTLQIALVEDEIRFSGESSVRYHPMVVRALANLKEAPKPAAATTKPAAAPPAKPNQPAIATSGYPINDPLKPTAVEYSFDLAKLGTELQAAVDSYEIGFRSKNIEKRSAINTANLAVVAFVQNERTKEILQAVYVKVKPALAVARQ